MIGPAPPHRQHGMKRFIRLSLALILAACTGDATGLDEPGPTVEEALAELGGVAEVRVTPSTVVALAQRLIDTSGANLFRVGPGDYALDYADGPAQARLFARAAETGEPLPQLYGTGRLNMKSQGSLRVASFEDAGTTVPYLVIQQPNSAQGFSGVARVGGEGSSSGRTLQCGFEEDARGKRQSEAFALN